MTTFSEYWDKKSQKRRKSWAAKAKRFAEQHTQLEDIRKEVYLPLDFGANFSFEDYKPEHFIKLNPITSWQDKNFCFSEEGLRAALKAEGADMNSFGMSVSRQPIKGLEAPQPENEWEAYRFMKPNKVYDYDKMYRSWLQRIYEICTDVKTVSLGYRQITMTIKRYSTEGMPFGYYELNPCEQLTKSAMLMQETDFYTLNVATLLMEAAAEWDLRQEELNYYAKKLRIRTMDAALTDDISFELWDDKKLEKKIAEYVSKDYPVEKIIEQVLRPWKQAITKYFHDITEQEINNSTEKFHDFDLKHSHDHSAQYIKNVLQPFFNKHGLAGINMWIPDKGSSPLFMENQGYLTKYNPSDAFYPNAHYSMCAIYGELNNTPLRALAYFLQKMPEITIKTDEVVIKVMHLYDGLMLQKHEAYRKNVEYLDSLAAQHKGTPVGRMMKFLRWNAGRLGSRLSVSSVKVLGETSFSFLERTTLMAGNQPLLHEEEVKERWIDTDCQNLYAADPNTTDLDEWVITHRKGILVDRWSWSIQDFLSSYSPRDSKPSLSIDFIEQKL